MASKDEFNPSDATAPETAFQEIALAFSGGGFRASAFALGVLSYFDNLVIDDPVTGRQLSLRENIKYISTASGGTLTGIYFALSLAKGKNFQSFYEELYKSISGEFLLENALSLLNHAKTWDRRPHKRRNLINSFALAYDSCLFQGATLNELTNPENSNSLQEVCFNATDMFKGLTFRQHTKMAADRAADTYFLYGNYFVSLERGAADKLLLSDIMAASSCFPMGFEPVVFPDDFAHPGVAIDSLKSGLDLKLQSDSNQQENFVKEKTIGLMDGGITDNQGLQSLMLADMRRMKGETSFSRFDFIMVNDVGSDYMKPYVVPPVKRKGLFFRQSYRWIGGELLVATLVTLIATGYLLNSFYNTGHDLGWTLLCAFIASILLVVDLAMLRFNYFLFRSRKTRLNVLSSLNLDKTFSTGIVKKLRAFFERTSVKLLQQMVKARLRSFFIINNDIFLKHVRRLIYEKFFEYPVWASRRKSNHVYDLSKTNKERIAQKLKHKPYASSLAVSMELQNVAQRAYQMPTTLWFDKQQVKDQVQGAIVSCGQFTACYNLLEYIFSIELKDYYQRLPDLYKQRLLLMKTRLISDLKQFNDDPYFLHNKLLPKHKLSNLDEEPQEL